MLQLATHYGSIVVAHPQTWCIKGTDPGRINAALLQLAAHPVTPICERNEALHAPQPSTGPHEHTRQLQTPLQSVCGRGKRTAARNRTDLQITPPHHHDFWHLSTLVLCSRPESLLSASPLCRRDRCYRPAPPSTANTARPEAERPPQQAAQPAHAHRLAAGLAATPWPFQGRMDAAAATRH